LGLLFSSDAAVAMETPLSAFNPLVSGMMVRA
jgi:hypothetical protein